MHKFPNPILLNGSRLGDQLNLKVFQKGNRIIPLNRTRYLFHSSNEIKIDFQHCSIELPTLKNESFLFELILLNDSNNEDMDSRFYLKSIGRDLFRLNGNFCKEAFVERGDVVDMGFNKLRFLQTDQQRENQKSLSLNTSAFAANTLPVLIVGETGTGKTSLAKKIHDQSLLSGNFVHLNLSAFSKNILESELFGHSRGAFTGAINDKKGAIAEAQNGTLFLDEIDSVSIDIQTKLLLFLESGEYRPVGSNLINKSNARLIFSSGQNLEFLTQQKTMRKDFYYRLNSGFSLTLPSLSEKPQLVLEICKQFEDEEYVVISDDLKQYYMKISWPGNIRQLVSHLKKKKVLSNGKKFIYDDCDKQLLFHRKNESNASDEKILSLEEIKYQHTLHAFERLNQNITVTSKILGVSPNTLRSILRKSA